MNPTPSAQLPSFVESEKDLEFALDSHSIAIFQWDALTNEITWAPGSAERLGMDPPSNYDEWAAFIEPDDLASTMETLERAAAAHAPSFRYSFRMKDKDGGVRVVEGSSRCSYDAAGNLQRTLSVAVDVTHRYEVRRALSASHDQFQSILETSPAALIITDDRGSILSFSHSAEKLFKRNAADVIGQHFNILTDQKVRVLLTAAKRTQGEVHLLSALRSDGTTVPVEVSAHEFGKLGHELFTIFIRDVSERIQAEQHLEKMRDELAHSARLNTMGEVAAGIAHELNQPLTAMTNYLAAAKNTVKSDEIDQEQIERLIGLASQQALRAGDIIRKMREFLTRGDIDLRPYPVRSLITEAVSLTSLGGRQPSFELSIEIDDHLPEVMVDRIQIQQVLVNLIKNAVDELRRTPVRSPKVTICATNEPDDHVSIVVEDNGPGLPPELLDHLYEPFTSTKKTGMGLGLSISRRIVEAHGSPLVGENRKSGGAIFRFNLPKAQKDDPS